MHTIHAQLTFRFGVQLDDGRPIRQRLSPTDEPFLLYLLLSFEALPFAFFAPGALFLAPLFRLSSPLASSALPILLDSGAPLTLPFFPALPVFLAVVPRPRRRLGGGRRLARPGSFLRGFLLLRSQKILRLNWEKEGKRIDLDK